MGIAIIGDCHASNIEAGVNWGRDGLPIWDFELKEKLEELKADNSLDKIYFSCGFPLMGCTKKEEILALEEYDFLSFSQSERGFYSSKVAWRKFSRETNEEIYQKYFRWLEYLVKDTRIILLPITAYWHEIIRQTSVDMPLLYPKLIQDFPTVNLEFLTTKFQFLDRFGKLAPETIQLIKQRIYL